MVRYGKAACSIKSFLLSMSLTLTFAVNLFAQVEVTNEILGTVGGCQFGHAIEISDDGLTAIAGGHGCDFNGIDSGMMRVFKEINGQWEQIGEDVLGDDTFDKLGTAVSVNEDGSRVAVGASNSGGLGYVQIYEVIADSLQHLVRINGSQTSSLFGDAISLSADGKRIVVGSRWYDYNEMDASGRVEVFEEIDGNWLPMGNGFNGETGGMVLGTSMKFSDDGKRIVMGGNSHVAIIEETAGEWNQVGEPLIGEDFYDRFGKDVAISGDGKRIIAGAWLGGEIQGDANGYAKIFEEEEEIWTQVGETIRGDSLNDILGFTVDMSQDGKLIAVASHWFNLDTLFKIGMVQVFNEQGGQWMQASDPILGEEAGDSAGYGLSFSADGSRLAVSSPWNDLGGNSAGKIRFFGEFILSGAEENQEWSDEPITVFPNPSNGQFLIEFKKPLKEERTLQVYNILGQRIWEERIRPGSSQENIELTLEKKGTYFLSIVRKGEVRSKTLVVEKE